MDTDERLTDPSDASGTAGVIRTFPYGEDLPGSEDLPSSERPSPMPPPDVALLDSRDSFTFNLAHAFAELGASVEVVPAHALDAARLLKRAPRLVCIGPGPRGPAELPSLVQSCETLLGHVPLFGVCLGMQALALAAGGQVGRARSPVHGKRSPIRHGGRGAFEHLPDPLWVMRYHSLVVSRVPEAFDVLAHDEDGQPMSIASDDAWAVQFHPESVGTAGGLHILAAVLRWAGVSARAPRYREGAVPRPEASGRRVPHG